jgi:DNA-directed RNA polymerase specialized sigma24 family protein
MTFIKVFDKLDRYRPDRKVRPWILTIAHNTALKTMRLPVKTGARLDSDPAHTPV